MVFTHEMVADAQVFQPYLLRGLNHRFQGMGAIGPAAVTVQDALDIAGAHQLMAVGLTVVGDLVQGVFTPGGGVGSIETIAIQGRPRWISEEQEDC